MPRDEVLATVFRGSVTCVSHAQAAGLPVYPAPTATHVWVPSSRGLGIPRRRPDSQVVLHRTDAVVPARALTHLDVAAHCVGPRDQLAMLDAALNTGVVVRRELELLTQGTVARRDWLRRHADGRSQSLSETCARVEMVEAGLNVVPQFQLNSVGRIDFLVESAVVVEIDSEAHHSGERARARDGDRDRAATTQGYPHLRYMFHDALERPEEIVADVVGTLMRFGLLTPELRTRLAAASRVSGWRELR